MATWLKVTLGVAVVVLLMLVTVVGGAHLFVRTVGEPITVAMSEGREFGQARESRECVDEAVLRLRADSALANSLRVQYFLVGCLEVSRGSPDFCAGVPPPRLFFTKTKWHEQQCANRDMSDNPRCEGLFMTVQNHCSRGEPSR